MAESQLDWEAIAVTLGGEATSVVSDYAPVYEQLIGFLPPKVSARFHVTGALDPHMVELQEKIRSEAMNPACLDQKTVQLMLFGMLLMDLNDATYQHGIAARRAGASWHELQAVVNLCFLFRGLPAANRGAEFLARVAQHETKLRPASPTKAADAE